MMKMTFLGTGTSCGIPQPGCHCPVCSSPDPHDKRLRCSALFESGDTHILIDCGPDFREQMLRIGWDKPFDAVFITHEHYDHVGGIDDLRPFTYHRPETHMYADPFCAQHLRERLPYCLVSHTYPGIPRLELHDIKPHDVIMVGDIKVTALKVMHGKLPIMGYRVGDIGYITDMTDIEEESVKLLEGIKLLVVNGLRHYEHRTHQTIEQACDFSRRIAALNGRDTIPTYLIHMSHHMGCHADEEAMLPKDIHLAYDGLGLTI